MGCDQLALSAVKESEAGRLNAEGLRAVYELVSRVESTVKEITGSDAVGAADLPPAVRAQSSTPLRAFPDLSLLRGVGMDALAGDAHSEKAPVLANLLDLPDKVTAAEEILDVLTRCDAICMLLLQRARDGSSSSRFVLQQQIIQLIGQLFTRCLPVPAAPDTTRPCLWRTPFPRDTQKGILRAVHKLALVYGSVWQAVEEPSRMFDSERALVASAMLAVFDACARTFAVDIPLILTYNLTDDGGYVPSHTVTQANRSLDKVSSGFEFAVPEHQHTRCRVLEYFFALDNRCANTLFDLRMPEKIEFKKYGSTCLFLRRLLERSGMPLLPMDGRDPPPEMEALMDWMLNEHSRLGREQPEFYWLRDMVVLFKFLSTMETRESEQMRRRTNVRENFLSWTLSFEEGGRRG